MDSKISDKKTIVHIVNHDKFTVGYVNFMKMYMVRYNHKFIIPKKDSIQSCLMGFVNDKNIKIIDKGYEIIKNKRIKKDMYECDKIIVSGVFGINNYLLLNAYKLLNKTYFHFWGADFYSLNTKVQKFDYKLKILRYLKILSIKKCYAIINLIAGDYDEIRKIIGQEKKHFVAPMPGNPLNKINVGDYRNRQKTDNVTRILLGNSSTRTNQHFEALNLLEHFKDEAIEIYCPLSYGTDRDYKDEVISYGKKIFKEKFIPLTDFMEIHRYMDFLSVCDIGVFNHNRQQGLGNIKSLIGMGKKVYVNNKTSTYKYLKEKDYKIFETENIKNISFSEFSAFSQSDQNHNINTYDIVSNVENSCKMWQAVFDDEGK